MELIQVDNDGLLFVSPEIDDWAPVHGYGISLVIDLDGKIDSGIPDIPNEMVYIYFPIYDENLPNLKKLHGLARMAAQMVRDGHPVLTHCQMGLNRSPLMAALILTYLGVTGAEALETLQRVRPGALYNEQFAEYLSGLPHQT